jgi:hypothetical protein
VAESLIKIPCENAVLQKNNKEDNFWTLNTNKMPVILAEATACKQSKKQTVVFQKYRRLSSSFT